MSKPVEIDDKLLSYLEDLSLLRLSDEEKPRIVKDLGEIINYINKLSELDTENIPQCSHPFDNVNAFRSDEAQESYERELILKNAANENGEMFIAPKTVDTQ
ncbi:MAG: Asp-tRNA(Asn)/Glu-tRNA(Gln) amidotransferase subunit GatC [Oscillospiraceae bacterium]|nr:Asp-tRNA(Asn)/Glu-tRNA(Gln) amidotransferase subunit GatC [Oscillospiraceae bacterium]